MFSDKHTNFVLHEHIIMVNLTTYKLSLIAEKRNTKDYKKKDKVRVIKNF